MKNERLLFFFLNVNANLSKQFTKSSLHLVVVRCRPVTKADMI